MRNYREVWYRCLRLTMTKLSNNWGLIWLLQISIYKIIKNWHLDKIVVLHRYHYVFISAQTQIWHFSFHTFCPPQGEGCWKKFPRGGWHLGGEGGLTPWMEPCMIYGADSLVVEQILLIWNFTFHEKCHQRDRLGDEKNPWCVVITHHNHNMACNKPKDKQIVYDYDSVFVVYGVWLTINGVWFTTLQIHLWCVLRCASVIARQSWPSLVWVCERNSMCKE